MFDFANVIIVQCFDRSTWGLIYTQARKVLQRLRGIARFEVIQQGHYLDKSQASSALNHIHFWSRTQAEIKARWMGMVTDGRLRQKKLENQLKVEAKLHELEVFTFVRVHWILFV